MRRADVYAGAGDTVSAWLPLLAAGLLEDPRAMLGRLNSLLEKLLQKQA